MLVLVCVSGGQAWETEEMDMFDLVEEVGVERSVSLLVAPGFVILFNRLFKPSQSVKLPKIL